MENGYRQGEILFIKTTLSKVIKEELQQRMRKKSDNVIREGEVSGHMHEVVGGDLMVLPQSKYISARNEDTSTNEYVTLPDGEMFVTSDGSVEIRHPEHASLKLAKGDYVVRIQREYDENSKYRQVSD